MQVAARADASRAVEKLPLSEGQTRVSGQFWVRGAAGLKAELGHALGLASGPGLQLAALHAGPAELVFARQHAVRPATDEEAEEVARALSTAENRSKHQANATSAGATPSRQNSVSRPKPGGPCNNCGVVGMAPLAGTLVFVVVRKASRVSRVA